MTIPGALHCGYNATTCINAAQNIALDRGQDSRGTDTSGAVSRHRLHIPNTGNDFHKNNIALVKGGGVFCVEKSRSKRCCNG